MNAKSIFARLNREDDGTFTTSHGPFILQTALQPIFGQDANQALELAAFEGLVRTSRNGQSVPPSQFFPLVARAELPTIDSLCRTLHILNAGQLHRRNAKLFVNFHPGLFLSPTAIRQEVERISIATHETDMKPEQIVCEISRTRNEDIDATCHLADSLRDLGFKIAVDEFGAQSTDAERVDLLKPEFVKFETTWVLAFMEDSAGYALLRVMVEQFLDRGIQPVFEGLEELSQVALCQELGVPLMQGYVLARPELAPTSFNQTYPEPFEPTHAPHSALARHPGATAPARRSNAFGKRGI
jgi:EAL domain-containing protein (putative c-di-GMP-specific phosphodiesterase class I)